MFITITHSFIYSQWNLDLTNRYITNDFLQPGKNYSKMYRTEPRFNQSPFNEILVIITTNTIQNPNRKIYLDITNKCQHMIKMKAKQTNKDKFMRIVVLYSSVLHQVLQ